ncbi:lytic transglycosylase domain-containing protein [Oculatella sp. LEGE 06141]|uniref:lytic transglycosylase domain-containing protein n=1 Tax=Oculatella sp. LEGE 06141 TaxID=1828648 RepID=UPI00187E4C1B|nr:lytic transglycosylase domain-containing protein [Oculatella sp. LEGE 06141]
MLGVGLALSMNPSIAQAEVASNSQEYVTLSDHLVALRRAIIGQESSSNFRAVNPYSGALGYGQVMPANVASWTREALGHSISQADFLNSPDIQLQVIDYKLNQYWQDAWATSGGDVTIAIRQVASRWYSGNPQNYTSTAPEFYAGRRYPSIAEYSFSILQRYVAHVRGMRSYTY